VPIVAAWMRQLSQRSLGLKGDYSAGDEKPGAPGSPFFWANLGSRSLPDQPRLAPKGRTRTWGTKALELYFLGRDSGGTRPARR